MPRVPRLLDVSVPLMPGLTTYPGNPEFEISPVNRLAAGDSANNSRLTMGTHTGTHVDAPRHFLDDRPGVDALPLDLLIGRARVIDMPHRGPITAAHLESAGLREDLRVLLRTPNSAFWNDPRHAFHSEYTYVAEDGAKFLVDQGVKVVGVDYLSVEKFHTPGHPAHHALLGAGVVIIEGLNLSDADPGQYEMYCLPLRIEGADGSPARVVLKR
jgi:arylformamidase